MDTLKEVTHLMHGDPTLFPLAHRTVVPRCRSAFGPSWLVVLPTYRTDVTGTDFIISLAVTKQFVYFPKCPFIPLR